MVVVVVVVVVVVGCRDRVVDLVVGLGLSRCEGLGLSKGSEEGSFGVSLGLYYSLKGLGVKGKVIG